MYYISRYSIGGYLMHHGIEGQKWGVRNGPPYPLEDGIKNNLWGKVYRKNLELYANKIEKSDKKIIKKANDFLDEEVNKYFNGKSGKIKNKIYTKELNMAEKLIYKKDYLKNESKNDSTDRRKKLLKILLINSAASTQQHQQNLAMFY